MALKDIEIRILGCLIEKERTTPDQYPLTTNSLVLACNQKTNRDPVTDYSPVDIEHALQNLRDKRYVVTVQAMNERAKKHQHKMMQMFDLNNKSLAILAVLMLRGKQTPGELRQRTERYTHFQDIGEIDRTLAQLESMQPPMVQNYGRGPGQSQDRWGQLLGGNEEKQRPRVRAIPSEKNNEFEALKEEVALLRLQLNYVLEHLNLDLNDPDED
ncbi:MAG: YceH family protein [Trueperaceae bacterium]|nr:YceH family protein [Trueperaceae bacterium]